MDIDTYRQVDWFSTLANDAKQLDNDNFIWRLFSEAPDGYFLCDLSGKLVDGNSTLKKLLGYSKAESIAGQFFPDLLCFSAEQAKTLAAKLIAAANGDTIFIESWLVRECILSFEVFPVKLWNESWLFGIVRDITMLTTQQEKLKHTENRYRIISELISDYAYSVRVDWQNTPISLEVEWVVGSFEQIMGTEMQHVVAQWREFIHPDDIEVVKQGFADAIEGQDQIFEIRLLDRDQTYHWIRNYLRPVLDNDRVVRIYGAGQDIQATKLIQQQLEEAKAEAEAANRAKSAFLANMSHELRTPLTAILGYTELLMEDVQDNGHDIYSKDLANIHLAAQHLFAVIGDILDYARLETGSDFLKMTSFSVKRITDSVVAALRDVMTQNNNTLTYHIADDIGNIYSDQTKLRQILFNLLSNAAKFTQNGHVYFMVNQEQHGGQPHLVFRVEDNGVGIPPDKLTTIFEAFQQADSSMTRRFGGTGLGLAISRTYSQMMGGGLTVESTLDVGSIFTFILPYMSPQ